ncbi:hypothetical protein [Diaphorobacter sp.]|uniref:hypothetical protein n=1 Tax=Diaphorobacter sp. TaxID=1934310 RepID=UPI0025867842|nr:hypothetical protein [Diaphorobacter sp.]
MATKKSTPAAHPETAAAPADLAPQQTPQSESVDAVASTTAADAAHAADLVGADATTAAPPVNDVDQAIGTYQVGSVPIRHNGKFYDVGAAISLTDAEARRLDGLVIPAPLIHKE